MNDMNPSTFNLKNLPGAAPRLPSQMPPMRPPRSTTPLRIRNTQTPKIPSQQPEESDEPPSADKDIYKKYFEKNFGTGNWYVEEGYGGGLFEGPKQRGLKQ